MRIYALYAVLVVVATLGVVFNVVSNGIPMLNHAFLVLWSASRLLSFFQGCVDLNPWFFRATYIFVGVAALVVCFPASCLVVSLCSSMLYGMPRLLFACLCQRQDDTSRDARRRVFMSCRFASRSPLLLYSESSVIVGQ